MTSIRTDLILVHRVLTARGLSLFSSVPVGLRLGLHGRVRATHNTHAIRYLIDVDMHWNAPREAHPGEDRIYRCELRTIMLRIRNIDAAIEALNMIANNLAAAHELRGGGVAFVDQAQAGVLEIAVDPERIGIGDGDFILSDIREVTGSAADWS